MMDGKITWYITAAPAMTQDSTPMATLRRLPQQLRASMDCSLGSNRLYQDLRDHQNHYFWRGKLSGNDCWTKESRSETCQNTSEVLVTKPWQFFKSWPSCRLRTLPPTKARVASAGLGIASAIQVMQHNILFPWPLLFKRNLGISQPWLSTALTKYDSPILMNQYDTNWSPVLIDHCYQQVFVN